MEKPIEPVETTGYENLPRLLKSLFLVFSAGGIGLAIYYIFGLSIRGWIMFDVGFYYLIIALYLPCVFLILPARKRGKKGIPWYDLVAAALAFGIVIYLFLNAWEIKFVGWVPPSQLQFALAFILVLLVLEGGRRIAGPTYMAVCVILGLYPVFAGYMPGMFFGASFPFTQTMSLHVFSVAGLLGIPIRVIAEILIGFLLFAAVLIASGASKFFLDLALAILGKFRGGPAKVAVLSSGFFGSISGSVFANIVATGSFTIPAMKRLGYPAHYAGAIEACSSTGGVLMPPVMGASAFIMAQFLGIEYAVVVVAAVIPAVLYYWALLVQVDAYAARVGLKGLPQAELPSFKRTLKGGWRFMVVFAFLLWGLLYLRMAALTPFYAAALVFVLSFFSRETMMTPRRIIEALTLTGKLIVQATAVILPMSFILVGLIVTGVAPAFTPGLMDLSGGNIFLILVIGMVACYILGMVGVQGAYIFMAVTLAPAIIEIGGLNVLATHLFIIYYTMTSYITLPVAPGAFLAATMAGAPPMKTALTAMRLGVVLYFVPFFFIFDPALVLEGPILDILYLFPLALVGITLIAAGTEGYLLKVGRLGGLARAVIVVAGALIAFPELKTTIIGAALALFVIAIILIRRKMVAKRLGTI